MDCSALKCFILHTKMLSFTSTMIVVIVAERPLCRTVSMDYPPVFPSQSGIKGRLWLANAFQDGSHGTQLVFKVVVVKECLNSGGFLTYSPPTLGLGKRRGFLTSVHSREDGFSAPSLRPLGWGPGWLSVHYIRSLFPHSFLSGYLMSSRTEPWGSGLNVYLSVGEMKFLELPESAQHLRAVPLLFLTAGVHRV